MEWLFANWFTLVVVLLSFGFIIFVHELGHFAIAKKVGIRVHEFALGFGPRVLSHRKGETEYCLRAIPFGGFVRMEGEDDPEADPDDPGSFQNKPVLSQIAVVAGGCVMNYASALIVLLLVGFLYAIPSFARSSMVGSLVDGSPAAKAGLQVGDKVVAIDSQPVQSFDDLMKHVQPKAGQPLQVKVERPSRDGRTATEHTITVVPRETTLDDGTKIGQMGVGPAQMPTIIFHPAQSGMEVVQKSGEMLVMVTILPVKLIQAMMARKVSVKEVAQNTGGPLMIGQMFYEIYGKGIWALLFFWAFICASVGAFNLFPIPALDGARIVFLGFGALRGRPVDPRKEGMVHMAGLVMLLCVMVAFTVQDVIRIVKGVKFFSIIVGPWLGL